MSGDKKKLGKILLKQRAVTPDELERLLETQKSQPGHRLASVAQRSGSVPPKSLLKALSEQHGVPGIDLDQVVVPLTNLDLVPQDVAKQHLILPILVKEDRVFLAMSDPADKRVIEEIEFVTGRRVFPYVALHDALQEVITKAYAMRGGSDEHYIGPSVPEDYLQSLGLAPSPTPSEPPERPSGVVVDRDMPDTELDHDDDLGLAELSAKASSPHDPFASQVAPLPTEHTGRERPVNPKILVVDDEDDIRKMLSRVLVKKGFEVLEASKGLEALQLVRESTPDVILLDAMLPEVHGFDICRRIKGSKRYGHIPIIMVSAVYRGWRVAEDLRNSYGVDAFLEKPFKIGEVVAHVERALEGRASELPMDDMLSREASDALEKGMDLYRSGDLDGAIEKLQAGLSIDPLSFQLHYHLGLLCGRRDDVFTAIHALETAVDLQPRNFSALKNLAILYQRAGFKHKAIEMWERSLGAAPDADTREGIKEHLMSLL
jgi:DNA-binding response OmpR family regulator